MARKRKQKLNDDFLINHAKERFGNSRIWREQEILDRWKKDNDLYDGVFSNKEKKNSDVLLGQGRLFIPKTYSHLQRILVDVLDTYFFDKEEIVGIGSWKDTPSVQRKVVKALLNYRLDSHPIDFYQESLEAASNALRIGVGMFKVFPRLKTGKTGRITAYEPVIEALPPEDVFFDPRATWKDYYKHTMIHRMIKSRDHLVRMKYKNLDLINPSQTPDEVDEIKMQRGEDQGSPFSTNGIFTDDINNIFVYEIWTYLDINDDGKLESVSYVAGGDSSGPQVILRELKENKLPYRFSEFEEPRPPIILGSAYPEPHKQKGKSLPQVLDGLQRETNAIRNQRREAVALALRKPILVNRGAAVDLGGLINRRIGGVVMGDDISEQSVREMNISDPTNSSIQEQMRTDQDFFEATSIPPNLLGAATPREETATANQNNNLNANKKIAHAIRNLAHTLFIPAFKMLLRLEQTYETDEFISEVTNRVLGWNLRKDDVPPKKAIEGEFDITVNVGINKQQQLQRLFLMMERANVANQVTAQMLSLGVVQPGQAVFIDVMEIFKRIVPLLGEKNIQEFELQSQQPAQPRGGPPGIASAPGLNGGGAIAEQLSGQALG